MNRLDTLKDRAAALRKKIKEEGGNMTSTQLQRVREHITYLDDQYNAEIYRSEREKDDYTVEPRMDHSYKRDR